MKVTTNHQLARLREAAAAGLHASAAAKEAGLVYQQAKYWADKEGFTFKGANTRIRKLYIQEGHPAPDIMAVVKLHALMDQVTVRREDVQAAVATCEDDIAWIRRLLTRPQ